VLGYRKRVKEKMTSEIFNIMEERRLAKGR
jgi:hypothetical protein